MRQTSQLILRASGAAFLAVGLAAGAASAEPVTQCGQTVVEGELTADLDCSAYNLGPALILEGSLSLNGFTLTGNPSMPDTHPNRAIVYCPAACSITGPGTIRSGLVAVVGDGNVKLQNATISDTADDAGGVFSLRKISVEGCTFENNLVAAKGGRVLFLSSTVNNFEIGVWAFNTADVRDSTFTNGYIAIGSELNVKMRNVNISGISEYGGAVFNGDPFQKSVAKISGSTIAGNAGAGVSSYGRLTVRDSTISDNGGYGVRGNRVKLMESDVTGNCLQPQVPDSCADLYVQSAPALTETSCGTSLCWQYFDSCTTGESWGVCGAD